MKNRIVALAMASVMAFSLSACGQDDAPVQSVDEIFVDVIKDNTNEFDSDTDEDIVDLGNLICDGWDEGATFNDVAMIFFEAGVDPSDGGFFVGAATQTYCPEHSDKITGPDSLNS